MVIKAINQEEFRGFSFINPDYGKLDEIAETAANTAANTTANPPAETVPTTRTSPTTTNTRSPGKDSSPSLKPKDNSHSDGDTSPANPTSLTPTAIESWQEAAPNWLPNSAVVCLVDNVWQMEADGVWCCHGDGVMEGSWGGGAQVKIEGGEVCWENGGCWTFESLRPSDAYLHL